MRLAEIVSTSRSVRETSARLDKIRHLAACLGRVEPDEIEIAVALLSGELRQGRIGLGPATLREAMPSSAAPSPELTIAEVDAAFERIARTTGAGAAIDRTYQMSQLLARATKDEQQFLALAVLGELRQGTLEGLMVEAVASGGRASGRGNPPRADGVRRPRRGGKRGVHRWAARAHSHGHPAVSPA